jgi:arylsulfatase A
MKTGKYLVCLVFLLAPGVGPAAPAPARPNIVFIVVDDLGYHDLGCYGSTRHQTPHIDRLAQEGIRFTDFHTNGPVCSPTRAAILTGQYQQRSGIEAAIGFTKGIGMPLSQTTIAELLRPTGYRCGVFGKWHVGHVSLFGPNDQGFDQSVCSNNSPDYHSHISRDGNLDWFRDQQVDQEPGYLTDLVTKHTVKFIRDNRDRPFFTFVSHLAVHFPYQGPDDPAHRTPGKKWDDNKLGPLPRSEFPRVYKDMLEAVDASVGEVVATLEQLGLRERTFIFVTSDNGAYAWVGSNQPLRGEKTDLYEGGHRVPAIANWPGRIPSGVVSPATALTMDLAPTFLALTGTPPPPAGHFDGTDISGVLLRGASLPARTLFWRFRNASAVRRGPWKLVLQDGKTGLFNLTDDIGEEKNMAGEQPAMVQSMRTAWAAWERDVETPRRP